MPGSSDPVVFDELIHAAVADAAHNPYLRTTLRRIYDLSVRTLNLLQYEREPLEQMRAEHQVIVDAIEARDPARAAAARQHVVARNWFPTLSVHADDDPQAGSVPTEE